MALLLLLNVPSIIHAHLCVGFSSSRTIYYLAYSPFKLAKDDFFMDTDMDSALQWLGTRHCTFLNLGNVNVTFHIPC